MSNGMAAAEEVWKSSLIRKSVERRSREADALHGQNLVPELARPLQIETPTRLATPHLQHSLPGLLDGKVLGDFAEHLHREQRDHDVRRIWKLRSDVMNHT